jgi:hypothetical protein
MNKTRYWIITFTPDKINFFKKVIKSAEDITSVYLEFVRRFPKDYIITDMIGVCQSE